MVRFWMVWQSCGVSHRLWRLSTILATLGAILSGLAVRADPGRAEAIGIGGTDHEFVAQSDGATVFISSSGAQSGPPPFTVAAPLAPAGVPYEVVTATGPGSVAGIVWNDANANGRREAAEVGVGDVIVSFHRVLAAGWAFQTSTKTDSAGRYRIDGLQAATYAVVLDPGLAWRYAPTHVGTDDLDSDVSPLGVGIVSFATSTSTSQTIDAGLVAIAASTTRATTTAPATTAPATTAPVIPTTTLPTTTKPATSTTTPIVTTLPPTTRPGSCIPVRVMPLGDSITAAQESYRGPLYRWLVGSGRSVDFVGGESWEPIGGGDADHEGHGGYTIGPDSNLDYRGGPGNLAQNVDTWVPQARPDVILLTIGSNDLAGGPIVAGSAPIRLRALVAKLQQLAPSAWIILSDMLPNRWSPNSSPEIDAYNTAIHDIGAASTTDRVVWGNTLAGVRGLGFDVGTDLLDQVHLSVSGGEKWAQAWRPAVLASVDAVACRG